MLAPCNKGAPALSRWGTLMNLHAGGIMKSKRDLTAEELSPWWTHGTVIVGLTLFILSWWVHVA